MTNCMRLANRIWTGSDYLSSSELLALVESKLGARVSLKSHRTAFVVESQIDAIAACAYGIKWKIDFLVVPKFTLDARLRKDFLKQGISIFDYSAQAMETANNPAAVRRGRISVVTSGTTGMPKIVDHDAVTLNTYSRVRGVPENNWYIPYRIGSYAWFQMVFLHLFVENQHMAPSPSLNPVEGFEMALKGCDITSVSSTPTFWRSAMMNIDRKLLVSAPISNVTLGGEIVDQGILDTLSEMYPRATIKHIYASSEAGAAIIVSDREAGFPASFLEKNSTPARLKVVDGKLLVKSPYATEGGHNEWIDTGDLVKRIGNRYHFLGRTDQDVVNVGGNKASVKDIEKSIYEHENVLWTRVRGRKAPIVGELPVAEVVVSKPDEILEIEASLRRHCEKRLPEYAVPRVWKFLSQVPITDSLKS